MVPRFSVDPKAIQLKVVDQSWPDDEQLQQDLEAYIQRRLVASLSVSMDASFYPPDYIDRAREDVQSELPIVLAVAQSSSQIVGSVGLVAKQAVEEVIACSAVAANHCFYFRIYLESEYRLLGNFARLFDGFLDSVENGSVSSALEIVNGYALVCDIHNQGLLNTRIRKKLIRHGFQLAGQTPLDTDLWVLTVKPQKYKL